MLDDEPQAEVDSATNDEPVAETAVVDIQKMRDEITNSNRAVHSLKQEMVQLRGQVQRNLTQLKQLEARVARR